MALSDTVMIPSFLSLPGFGGVLCFCFLLFFLGQLYESMTSGQPYLFVFMA